MSGAVKAVTGAVKGVVKGVSKAVKGVVKGVSKVFKAVTSSGLGKIALAAGAIYLGGGAFGAWQTPFSSVNGAFVSGAESTLASGVASAPAEVLAGVAPEAAQAAVSQVASGIPVSQGTANWVAPLTNTTKSVVGNTPLSLSNVADVVVGSTVNNAGIISKAITGAQSLGSKAAKWIGNNPIPAAMGLNALSSAFQPDQLDLLEEQNKLRLEEEEAERARRERNLNVGNINLGISPADDQTLYDNQGNPVYAPQGGIIGGRIRRG